MKRIKESKTVYKGLYLIVLRAKVNVSYYTRHEVMGGVDIQLWSLLTLDLDRNKWAASYSSHFTPGKETPGPTEQEAGWVQKPVWILCRGEKSVSAAGNRNQNSQPSSPYPTYAPTMLSSDITPIR